MLTIKQCEDKLSEIKALKKYIGNKDEEYVACLDRLQIAYTKELSKALKRGEKKIGAELKRIGIDR